MPKVRAHNIVQDLTDLAASSNSLMQPCLLVPGKLEEDWFSLIRGVAEKIIESRNKTELSSVDLVVPAILSFLRPETEKKSSSNSLQENVSRAHIHKIKQDSDITAEQLANNAEHSKVSKSTVDANKTVHIAEGSCHLNTDPETDKIAITDHDSKEISKTASISKSKETNTLSSTNNSDETSKMRSVESDAEANRNSVDDSGVSSSSERAETKQSSIAITTKVSAGKHAKDLKENLSIATPKKEKLSIKEADNLQSENNYEQTPKASKGPPKSCYLTQVLDKKFKSLCQNVSESVQINDVKDSTSNSSKRKKEDTLRNHLRKEVLESNLAAKATRAVKENIPQKGTSQRSVITRNGANNSLLASQKNAPAVIQPTYIKNLAVKASAQVTRKEEEKLKELKMKEEKANENYKKLMTERQRRFEENKRKRQEKIEQAELKRQKMEKEKELQLIKKYAKPEVSSSTIKQTKTTEKRKYQEDVEETSETKHRAKREREEVVKKCENQKMNINTPTEMNVTKVLQKVENRSDELSAKHPKQPPNSINETLVLSKATPPSAPLKSKLNESHLKTPANNTSKDEITSYEMTPILNSDSEDESQRDRSKKIPAWAHGCLLKSALINQNHEARNPEEIFGSIIDSPNLEQIFCKKKNNYSKRTSSRIWDTTILIEAN